MEFVYPVSRNSSCRSTIMVIRSTTSDDLLNLKRHTNFQIIILRPPFYKELGFIHFPFMDYVTVVSILVLQRY